MSILSAEVILDLDAVGQQHMEPAVVFNECGMWRITYDADHVIDHNFRESRVQPPN